MNDTDTLEYLALKNTYGISVCVFSAFAQCTFTKWILSKPISKRREKALRYFYLPLEKLLLFYQIVCHSHRELLFLQVKQSNSTLLLFICVLLQVIFNSCILHASMIFVSYWVLPRRACLTILYTATTIGNAKRTNSIIIIVLLV